uniref:Uncharacterized protein n=1 Tax=Vertebrata isogona TaxID=2006944 RepID=A0A1Z1MFK6_9FLOR|nr:hypothetical protein [Vertebrata isogona]ARW64652.1 hypothetical protein [Vertebrata isogona]
MKFKYNIVIKFVLWIFIVNENFLLYSITLYFMSMRLYCKITH